MGMVGALPRLAQGFCKNHCSVGRIGRYPNTQAVCRNRYSHALTQAPPLDLFQSFPFLVARGSLGHGRSDARTVSHGIVCSTSFFYPIADAIPRLLRQLFQATGSSIPIYFSPHAATRSSQACECHCCKSQATASLSLAPSSLVG